MLKEYDYIIVGSGLYGAICARELTDAGKKCLVIEQRNHIGGNCYTEDKNGISIHKYGPHIFHTSNQHVWDYINKYANFNNYVNRPKVISQNKIYSFPINLFTLYQVFGVKTPEQAKAWVDRQKINNPSPKNLEEWVLSQVGEEIYKMFIKGYTEKQWGRPCNQLPSSIIKRLPIRFTFDDNYFNDKYQGIPIGGYTQIFEKLLEGIEVKLNTDYFKNRKHFDDIAHKMIYTGPIDTFYNYQFGTLQYRSLDFINETIEIQDFQGNAVINYNDIDIKHTRITEHKHFEPGSTAFENKVTIITKEYPAIGYGNKIPFYPIGDEENRNKYKQYKQLADNEPNIIFGGRLAEYQYYDMHHIIAVALDKITKEIKNGK